MSDPDATSVNFESIHLYKSVHDYPTTRNIETKYSSIFTYGGPLTISRVTGTQGTVPLYFRLSNNIYMNPVIVASKCTSGVGVL